jgi:hypothetical protein
MLAIRFNKVTVAMQSVDIRRGADKSLAFPISNFIFAAQPKEFFLDGLKK